MIIAKPIRDNVRLLLLGLILFLVSGCSVPQNNSDLLQLRKLKDQAFAGDIESQYQLGIHYSTRGKWSWDKSRGYGWLLDAARAGHTDAQYMVGMSQFLGRGTKKNRLGAMDWLEQAAAKGHPRSQYQLGQIFLNGTGTVKDPPWGRYWLEQAAWAGHAEAQFFLAALFSKGIGGQKNVSETWNWLKRAEQNGDQSAKLALEKITATLSEQQIQTGKKLLQKTGAKGQNNLYRLPKIRYVQTLLNAKGFSAGAEDGESGRKTEAAIRQYMQKNKMPHSSPIDILMDQLRGKNR